MTAIGMVLKSLGIEITDEHRRQIEALIPQVPARAVQVIGSVNAAVAQMNANTEAINALRFNLDVLIRRFDVSLENDTRIMGTIRALQEEITELRKDFRENESNRNHDHSAGPAEPAGTGARYLNGNPAKRKRALPGA